jgi:Mn-dependent DtxR family transcriptional regulator
MDYYVKQGQFATIRVIADEFNTAHSNMRLTVKRLENKGYIRRDWYGPPKVLRDEDGCPVIAVGRFIAGQKQ